VAGFDQHGFPPPIVSADYQQVYQTTGKGDCKQPERRKQHIAAALPRTPRHEGGSNQEEGGHVAPRGRHTLRTGSVETELHSHGRRVEQEAETQQCIHQRAQRNQRSKYDGHGIKSPRFLFLNHRLPRILVQSRVLRAGNEGRGALASALMTQWESSSRSALTQQRMGATGGDGA
jgi:hypothetical protein